MKILIKWYQLQIDKIFLDDLEDIIPLEFQRKEMSRTRRRKHLTENIWGYGDPYIPRQYKGCTLDQAEKKLLAEFHGDNHPGRYSPPRAFCHQLNKKTKIKNDQELSNLLKLLNFSEADFVGTPNKKDAGWIWW